MHRVRRTCDEQILDRRDRRDRRRRAARLRDGDDVVEVPEAEGSGS